jgi:hypothetical protein
MKRILPPRKRARAIAKVRAAEQPSMDWVAFALAVWLAMLVGVQLLARLPEMAQPHGIAPVTGVRTASYPP